MLNFGRKVVNEQEEFKAAIEDLASKFNAMRQGMSLIAFREEATRELDTFGRRLEFMRAGAEFDGAREIETRLAELRAEVG